MTITINVANGVGKINEPVHITANITSDIAIKNIEWINHDVNFSVSLDQKTLNYTPSENGQESFLILVTDNAGAQVSKEVLINVGGTTPPPPPLECPPGQHKDPSGQCVPDTVPPPPPPPATGVIYDSHIDSKLHDGKVRTIGQEGVITGCGKGAECRASGSPKIVVNADGTFSLVSGSGAPRNLSLKLRSRHNEGGDCLNRFGGYGFAVDKSSWDAKREPCHNNHDESSGGSHGGISTGQYFKVEFSVKDEGGKVREIGKVNGKEVMNKLGGLQDAPKSLFAGRSYIWLRLNNSDFGRIYIYACNYDVRLELEAKFDSGNSITFKDVKLFAI